MTDVDLEAVERAIREHTDPVVTAGELAEPLGCSSRHVLDLLRLLEREGSVKSKQAGARAVAWWHIERVRPPQSHERIANEQPANSERTTKELQEGDVLRSEPATELEEEEPEEEIDTTDEIEQAVNAAAESWSDPPERIEARKQAARAALAAIRENAMSKSEILDEVEPHHPVEGQAKRTWWRKNLSESNPSPLKQLAEYSNSTKKWEYTGN